MLRSTFSLFTTFVKCLFFVFILFFVIPGVFFGLVFKSFEKKEPELSKDEISRIIDFPSLVSGGILQEKCGSGFDGYACSFNIRCSIAEKMMINHRFNMETIYKDNWELRNGIYSKNVVFMNPYPIDLTISWHDSQGELKCEERKGQFTKALRLYDYFKTVGLTPKRFYHNSS